ncbi:MAG: Gfo/Idh/MocA family oxidoreductase, partial [Pirellulaceae bacterium]|nr:Gfo/Idh/MocA family oxidoreductase [Pirellulaceae bacterium]
MSDRDAPAVRWGVIGCGDVVKRRVAQAILNDPDSELTALCRRDASRLADFGREFGVERRHTCWRELIEQGGLDAVYIATPVSLHREQTMAAANAGLHVLVEKPMAMRAAECAEMIAACEQADVRLGVAYYRRFYPVVERI